MVRFAAESRPHPITASATDEKATLLLLSGSAAIEWRLKLRWDPATYPSLYAGMIPRVLPAVSSYRSGNARAPG